MNRALKVRIYPNKAQKVLIDKTLGCSRAIFNMMLHERKETYNLLKDDKRSLYEYNYKSEKDYKEEFDWLKEVDSIALQQSRLDLSSAYQNFFRSLSGKRKGPKMGFPKFKKKKNDESYRTVNVNNCIRVDFKIRKLKLPKLGYVKFRDSRNSFPGLAKSATVSRTATGKYFVSILFDIPNTKIESDIPATKTKVLGLDMSLDQFYVDQNGSSPNFKRWYRVLEPRLKKAQRRASKKQKGSNNSKKAFKKVASIHEKIRNSRKDFLHKLSNQLTKDYDVIVTENLSLKGMSQALNLGKSVNDLGYSEFLRQLDYKSIQNNCVVLKADKWFASSKICSCCGFKNKNLTLNDRDWVCPKCQTNHNRDQNAGKNLFKLGFEILGLEQPDLKLVENPTTVSDSVASKSGSMKQESNRL